MTHSAVAANAAELPAAELAAGAARQWAQLLPVGAINGRDGRRFRLSRPAALVEAFRRDPRPLPVDYEHASAASRTTGAPAPAAGWITDLKVAENAIWGLIEWNEKARAMVAAREYRFLSPEFLYDPASGEVRALLSAGLVHRPNLALAALNRQEAADMTPPRTEDDALRIPAAVLEALRLPNDTDVEAALAAIATLREAADPEKVVPVAAMRERVLADLARVGVVAGHRLVSHHHVVLDPAYVHITRASLADVADKKRILGLRGVHSVGRYGSWTYCSIEDNIVEARDLARAFNALPR